MKRKGICQKCGKETIIRDHHIHGYDGEHKDEVVPYCYSCDYRAHNKARREGKCQLNSEEAQRLSRNSSHRRTRKYFNLSCKTVGTNIRLFEELFLDTNNGKINIWSRFSGHNGKKLKIIGEN